MRNACRELALRHRDDLAAYSDHGAVKVIREGARLKFSYVMRDVEGWNLFERQSRGMIVDYETGEIVAWPFEKFFNLGEPRAPSLESLAGLGFTITEKIDGSLGILWRDEGGFRITTRGSFANPYGEFATAYWHEHHGDLEIPLNMTLLFEIVWLDDPQPKVIKYDEDGLVLIGVIDRYTGSDYGDVRPFGERWGLETPDFFDCSVEDLVSMAENTGGVEGWVALFENGVRLKVKAAEYLKIFRLLNQVSEKNLKELLLEDRALEWLAELPEELRGEAQEIYDDLAVRLEEKLVGIYAAYSALAHLEGRKEFALAALRDYPEFSSFLFSLRDDRFDEKAVIKRL